MKRTIAIKLELSQAEMQALLELQEKFSSACNQVAEVGFRESEHNRIRLHHMCYLSLRENFPELGSQMCCNAIAKAAQALKASKCKRKILFKHGSVHFDKRTYSLKGQTLSLFTLQKKRIQIQLEISLFHQKFLDQGKIKEAELVRRGKRYFFHLVLDLPDVPLAASDKVMAVDLGENVLAATSSGKLFGGGILKSF